MEFSPCLSLFIKEEKVKFVKLSDQHEILGMAVVDIAFQIHKELGPGLMESVYEECFCYELTARNISFQAQKVIPVVYKNQKLNTSLRVDLLIGNIIICELKAANFAWDIWQAQLLTYLKLTKIRLGFIINFNAPLLKQGIKRMVV